MVEWKLTTFSVRSGGWTRHHALVGLARHHVARGATRDPTSAWWSDQPWLLMQKRGQFLQQPMWWYPVLWLLLWRFFWKKIVAHIKISSTNLSVIHTNIQSVAKIWIYLVVCGYIGTWIPSNSSIKTWLNPQKMWQVCQVYYSTCRIGVVVFFSISKILLNTQYGMN